MIVEPPALPEEISLDVIDEMRFVHASLLSLSAPSLDSTLVLVHQTAHHHPRLLDKNRRNFFTIHNMSNIQANLVALYLGNSLPHRGAYVVTGVSTITKQVNLVVQQNDTRSSIAPLDRPQSAFPLSYFSLPLTTLVIWRNYLIPQVHSQLIAF